MAGEPLLLRVRCDAHAPGTVRAAMANLQELGWTLGDAMLVASELVTNAVLHSGCSNEDELVVSVLPNDCLRITVADPGSSGGRAEIAERDVGLDGLGLRVVQQLVQSWGSDRRPDSHVVWAELSLAGESRADLVGEVAQPPVTYSDGESVPSMPAN